ncbi:glycosyltransferase family 4 protein [Flavobacterium restrictum]|uniref:Glycosyltransferase family 4 protein n=1 Tax=Flavobacterium restrictum TaxID=2594428 RepID=A0A553E5B6_9FLAO|nr:glycosyltransferase family 4 protein [Flavobacterium restrictum]TRX40141.1 glycosyltransferase family 4 protein [Flavobacterium restrictum]
MKILIISQYFWPENFKINDLAVGLKERGHQVSVLTGIPNYPKGSFFGTYAFFKKNDEIWNGIPIYRSKIFPRGNGAIRLMINYLSFMFFCSIKVLFIKEKFDKILVYQPSPVTVGVPAIIAGLKMKAPFYFWVQDLWPASLSAAGGISNKTILSLFNTVTIYIYKKAQLILVQSKGFVDYIEKQGDFKHKTIYYPNTAEAFYKPVAPEDAYLKKLPKGFNLIFAGNLGEAQGISTLIDAARIVKDYGISVNWIFLGEGRQKEAYLTEIKSKNLHENFYFLGSFSAETMPYFFACADALIVSLKKDIIFSLTIPSKIQSYLASGKPILAALDGEGAKVILEAKAGFVSPPGDAQMFAQNTIDFYNLATEQKNMMKTNAIDYFNIEFEREMLLSRLEKIFAN